MGVQYTSDKPFHVLRAHSKSGYFIQQDSSRRIHYGQIMDNYFQQILIYQLYQLWTSKIT